MSGDLIRREDAIEALREYEVVESDNFTRTDPVSMMAGATIANCIEAIVELPSAEPERKKGHWVEVYGYYTPGGDPVWKCSECGKGIHVYGIEAPSYNRDYADGQWVACPNCGADMTEE